MVLTSRIASQEGSPQISRVKSEGYCSRLAMANSRLTAGSGSGNTWPLRDSTHTAKFALPTALLHRERTASDSFWGLSSSEAPSPAAATAAAALARAVILIMR